MTIREIEKTPQLPILFGKAALTGHTRRGGPLPATVYRQSGMRIDTAHLARYDRVCGLAVSDELPTTYPHMLSFPLQAKLMTDGDFPFPLVGSVHVANRITVHRPLLVTDVLELSVHCENLRPHPRGMQFDVISTARAQGERVWHEASTYLRRGAGASPAGEKPPEQASEDTRTGDPGQAAAALTFRVPADTGRRYAEVSGDRNPIHLHPLTARLFGFSSAIAHGMWTKARCLAALQHRLPGAYTVNVAFKLPILLPATVDLGCTRVDEPSGEAGWNLLLRSHRDGKPHLRGSVRTLAPS
ncbi:MAG: MaoC/PaaZ C-terminal domain-containing protein [Sciscionella sp.]